MLGEQDVGAPSMHQLIQLKWKEAKRNGARTEALYRILPVDTPEGADSRGIQGIPLLDSAPGKIEATASGRRREEPVQGGQFVPQ